ncbi:D-alanine--D-alanine ligase, partial [Methanosalsum natronophilum]
ENRKQFEENLGEIREGINFIHKPFLKLLELHEVPDSISKIKESCIVESPLYGRQCTIEGYVFNGEVNVYGVVDSLKEQHFSSFSSYEYPSSLPQWVQDKIIGVATTFIKHIDLDNSAFNMEFFYNNFTEEVYLLEVNTRISQSHADLFEKVHGTSHHQIMLQIALGEHPAPLGNNGKFKYASKFMLRTFEVGTVMKVPTNDDIKEVEEEMPGTVVNVLVEETQELENLELQDSYSYELAEIYIGGNSRAELREKYQRALEMLPFTIQTNL